MDMGNFSFGSFVRSPSMRRLVFIVLAIGVGYYLQERGTFTLPVPSVSPSSVLSVSTSSTNVTDRVPTTTIVIVTPNAHVVRVVDGDTIVAAFLDHAETSTIRFLGMNTPETVDPRRPVECFGKEASKFVKQLLTDKDIRLVADPEADDQDNYGRLLRNIVLLDGTDVNALLVREGYAYAYVSFPQNKKRKTDLKRLEQEAKSLGRGLWSSTTCAGRK